VDLTRMDGESGAVPLEFLIKPSCPQGREHFLASDQLAKPGRMSVYKY
jgi:hypothetical protein